MVTSTKTSWNNEHVLKISDNKAPEILSDGPDPKEYRSKIEPWLTALFQSEHLSVLAGSGLPSAVHLLATGKTGADMGGFELTVFKDQVERMSETSAKKTGRGEPNIEDQIRTINELIKGLEVYISTDVYGSKKIRKELNRLKLELESGITEFANTILFSEKNIVGAMDPKAAEYLMSFLLSFASRSATRERLNFFTTNYDRIVEFGAELAGLHLIDRFIGTICPIFRSSRLGIDLHYNPPGIRGEPRYLEGVVNFTKLHGSLDWTSSRGHVKRNSLPYGAENIATYIEEADQLMIYPNSAKDRETAEYPYVELFRDFASAICRPNSTIVTYGYGFGDEHINRVVADMLTIPSTHLVIIAYNDPGDRIKLFYDNAKRPVQISLLIGNHFGNLESLVDNYLPKPAIDKATFRMAELLKARGFHISKEGKEDDDES